MQGGCNGLNFVDKGRGHWVWSLQLVISEKCVYLLVLSLNSILTPCSTWHT